MSETVTTPEYSLRQTPLRRHLPAFLLLLVLTMFRVFLAHAHELHVDEAYYWEWSRALGPAYYDQGPGVAFAIALGTSLLGNTELGVRFSALLCSLIIPSVMYLLTLRLSRSTRAGFFAILLFSFTPVNALGGVLMMHDSVMFLAWALLAASFLRYLDDRRARWLYACAVFMAVGVLSKHTMVLFAPPIVLMMLWCPGERRLLANPHAWGAVLLAVVLASPLLVWNLAHDFAGVQAIINLPTSSARGRPWHDTLLGYVAGQLVAVGPVALPLVLGVSAYALLTPGRTAATVFLAWSQLFMFGFFLIMSIGKNISGNWPVCSYFGGFILLGIFADAWWGRGKRLLYASAFATSALLVCLGLSPRLMLAVTGALGVPITIQELPVLRLAGGHEIAAAVEQIRAANPGALIASNHYQGASLLAFYLPDQPQVYSFNFQARPNQYDFWESPNRHIGRDFILCQLSPGEPSKDLKSLFARVETGPTREVVRLGRKVISYRISVMRGFRGLPPQNPYQDAREKATP